MRIVHVFRAPVGGLFRHVIDLAKEQAARGHEVGVFCDAHFAGERNEALLAELTAHLSLGLMRAPMSRNPHWTDIAAQSRLKAFSRSVSADVLHGHGAKGGFYARIGGLGARGGPIRAYTPHGGSLNYKPGTGVHRLYMRIERLLERGTDLFLFESSFIAERFRTYVGETRAITRVVLNGLYPHELEPIEAKPDASDFLYIGEFRFAKGIDILLAAMASLAARPEGPPTLLLVGQGPDEAELRAQVAALGLDGHVAFSKPMAARDAFTLARVMVVPSRFESMPYVVIEAAGALMPLISTNVGGIPEIFGDESNRLVAADDVAGLAGAMADARATSGLGLREPSARLQTHIANNFSVSKMAAVVIEAYGEAIGRRAGSKGAAPAPVHGRAG